MPEQNRLTVNDPVSPDVLAEIKQIDMVKAGMAERNMALDQEKVTLLAARRRIDNQHSEIFNKILVERGLPSDTTIQVDLNTGRIQLVTEDLGAPPAQPEQPQAETSPEQPAEEAKPSEV